MLNKQDIINILNEKQYPKKEYWITSGAALVIYGVKMETTDIDLGCTTILADSFVEKGMPWRVASDGTRIISVQDDIELLENWCGDDIVELHGFSVSSLDSIRREKIRLDRPKDWVDITLIDAFVSLTKK